jgi:Zn finger protein HypA/HybF involved in hydrogenase expression
VHEHGVIRDLMERVEREAGTAPVSRIRFRVGALSGITPDTLRRGAIHFAEEAWDSIPDIEVEESGDPFDPGALSVLLVSISLGD